ncbi:MAG TPA: molybdopterin cofactor-binding domain-containing protein [Sporichthyaceae bacterium]|jgi:isoquinoline 1-oxidoreductase beta subunit|nr:molybdopterin cofactor-binding domain-containing protein [Sporichthyaceae bacterium]
MTSTIEPNSTESVPGGVSRRSLLGWVVAAPTLVVAARLGLDGAMAPRAAAATATPIRSAPQFYDEYDLSDLLRDSDRLTDHLITITMNTDGTAAFALPRAEVGQGITTSFPMIIADELDLPLDKVRLTLSDANPALFYNQLTGGSSSTFTLWDPVRNAAGLAREQLKGAAAKQWNTSVEQVWTRDGVVHGPGGKSLGYGELATAAASATTRKVEVRLKSASDYNVIGRPQGRLDAREAVTGTKVYTMDLKVPNALPTMVARPPTLKGTVRAVRNLDAVKAMPGVTHVAPISTGVAVRARTFGQCIDAVRALQVDWGPGTVDGYDNAKVRKELMAAELPIPPAPPGVDTIQKTFTFNFRSSSPLESNCAVADVRADSAEIWSSLKMPIVFQQTAAKMLKLPQEKVTVHVMNGGGSFGRHLFPDAALEAVEASKAFGVPVRLMWHRTDDFRHGRTHPMATSTVRVSMSGGSVTAYDQRHTSVATDFTHGLGEMYSAWAATSQRPWSNLTVSEGIFTLTTSCPYNFGELSQFLNEIHAWDDFATGSVRNVYSPDTATARELMVDATAARMNLDAVEFRKQFVRDDRLRGVLVKCAEVGNWGRKMPAGTAQGLALHNEYKSRIACLMEIDTRAPTANRKVRDGFTGPRITKVVYVVDVGLPINPKGIEAQLLGGAQDGIAQALTSSLHFQNGLPLEGSWDNYWYTRQWNTPPEFQVVVMPPTTGVPGGCGELGCGVAQAAAACAYGRATGITPTEFPINFNQPLGFDPLPVTPSIPQSRTDGLHNAR